MHIEIILSWIKVPIAVYRHYISIIYIDKVPQGHSILFLGILIYDKRRSVKVFHLVHSPGDVPDVGPSQAEEGLRQFPGEAGNYLQSVADEQAAADLHAVPGSLQTIIPGFPRAGDVLHEAFQQAAEEADDELPARVRVHQRIVQAVAVAVEVLREVRKLHVGVGAEEAAQGRVVHAAVHVDEAEAVQVFMAGVAALEGEAVDAHRAPAPGIVGGRIGHAARTVHQLHDAAQVVQAGIVGAGGDGAGRGTAAGGTAAVAALLLHVDGRQAVTTVQVVEVAGHAALRHTLVVAGMEGGLLQDVLHLLIVQNSITDCNFVIGYSSKLYGGHILI